MCLITLCVLLSIQSFRLECLPMGRETWVQSLVKSYQRLKMVLDASLLNTQHYKVRIKGKVEQSWEGVAPSPTPWCSSYRKGSLRVTLDYGCQLYFYLRRSRFRRNCSRIVLTRDLIFYIHTHTHTLVIQ